MTYLQLNSARYILAGVAANDGQWGWYNVVRYVDNRGDSEKDPPSFHILNELTNNGYLREDKPNENNSKYSITEKGRKALAELQPSSVAQ